MVCSDGLATDIIIKYTNTNANTNTDTNTNAQINETVVLCQNPVQ